MDYQEFIHYIKINTEDILGKRGLAVQLSSIVKSSDNVRDCLLIRKNDLEGAPAIYLDDFYRMYEDGEDPDSIINKIIEVYDSNCSLLPSDINEFMKWDKARDHVTCRVMNRHLNRKYLTDAVYMEYLDLAIVLYSTVITREKHIFSCKINEQLLEEWNIEKEKLYRLALDNTKRMFGISLQEIGEAFSDMIMDSSSEGSSMLESINNSDRIPMYILSNDIKSQGAVNIFMDNVLAELAEKLDSDLYIIPSSIHEVMIVPAGDRIGKKEINAMIEDINLNLLEPQDILSNHVYFFSRTENRILLK